MRSSIRFLLGDARREIRGIDPTLTVLEYLRGGERRCGTKEGCAEGDCGTCTVVVGRLDGARIRYQAVNSCILFLPALDGCQLITVEDLRGPDGALHPVQEAMVRENASQCGYCTPGFIMSLFALYHERTEPPELDVINDVLAGNLCRCTGYGPIIAAARRMYETGHGPDRFRADEGATVAALKALQSEDTLGLTGPDGRRFYAPASVEALAELLMARPEACLVAGATDVALWVTKAQRRLDPVIYLGRVAGLDAVVETQETIEIGATATYSAAASALAEHYPDFGELIRRIGSVPIRNVGTIGGNIANASPVGDTLPPLIAAGAGLTLRRGDARRTIPLEDFFIADGKQDRRPGEFVESITVPKPAPEARFRCYKISKRFDQDIAAVCGAFHIVPGSGAAAAARIAYGGMAATPKRARHAEAEIAGRPWTLPPVEAAMAALEKDFMPIDDMRASKGYRMRVAQNLLMKLFVETTDPAAQTRLVGDRSLAHV
ncbi:MAG: xanthine dehydrogenase small subunit [Kiloniellaceae bacterium]